MQLSNVSNDDGRACAQLLAFLKAGRWDLTGSDAEKLIAVKRWVASLAQDMAKQLGPKPAPEASSMRVKSVGSLASGSKPKKKK